MIEHLIAFEVSSEFGLFSRPDTGQEPVSWPIPTPNAAKAFIQSIIILNDKKSYGVDCTLQAIAMCSVPSYESYTFNSYASIRKRTLVHEGLPCQIHACVLYKPRFQILAVLTDPYDAKQKVHRSHALQEMFIRRILRKRTFYNVTMGATESDVIFSFPRSRVEKHNEVLFGYPVPSKKAIIKNGVLVLGKNEIVNDNGLLRFTNNCDLQKQLERFQDPNMRPQKIRSRRNSDNILHHFNNSTY